MTYYSHDTENSIDDIGLANMHFEDNESDAWRDVGDLLWEWWKGDSEEVVRRYVALYEIPSDVDFDDIDGTADITKCKYVGTRSFCIPPHAPACFNGMVSTREHSWNEDRSTDIKDSEWNGCCDMSVPCSQCDVLKIIRVSDEPINNTSKQTIVRYEQKPVLEEAGLMIVSEPREHKNVKSRKSHTRVCGVCNLMNDNVTLFKADDNDLAVEIAKSILRNSYYSSSKKTSFLKYHVGVAKPGTKTTDEIFVTDLIDDGEYIEEGVFAFEPAEPFCISDNSSHKWSQESRLYREWDGICRDAIKYCNVVGCNVGKIMRIDEHETQVSGYITLSKQDVTYKDGLVKHF